MKKSFLMALMLGLTIAFTACGGDDETGTGGGGPTGPVSPENAKEFVENTAKELKSVIVANDFKVLTNLSQEFEERDINSDALEGIFDGIVANSARTRSTSYEYVTKTIIASNISGVYEASYSKKIWEKKSDGTKGQLKMTYTAKDGSVWVLNAKASGSHGNIFVDSESDWKYLGSTYNNGYYDYNYQVTNTDIYLNIPSTVTTTLTQNGNTIVSEDLKISKFAESNNRLTPKGPYEYTLTSKILGYEITSSASYASGQASNAKVSLTKNGTSILDVNASCTLGFNSNNEIKSGNANIDVSILAKLTAKVSVPEIQNLTNAVNADYDDRNREDSKTWAEGVNKCFSCKLYNGSNEMCTVICSIINDTKYNYYTGSYTYYKPTAVLNFSDGTTYDVEEYFEKKDFSELQETLESIIKDFENLAK